MSLQVKNINHYYSQEKASIHALRDISLHAERGDFVSVVGPSGCGKSTLLQLIAGLEQPTSGSIIASGKIGFMFQDPTLFPWLKVKDNVAFGLKIAGKPQAEIDAEVERYLRMVHLLPFRDAYPHQLSGGMKQRTALARTLVLQPEILLMDEPFAALDAQTREIMYGELQEIWAATNCTIIFVTHNVREAVCLGDKVLVLTARPGSIKKTFNVDLPRPRDLGDLEVIKLSNKINQQLKQEIDKVIATLDHEDLQA